MSTFSGSCFCGAVQFSYSAPSKWCAHCHCSMCRAFSGAAYVTWVGVQKEQFTLTAGGEALRAFHSSPEATRSHCGTCGCPLFFESTRWAGEIHVLRAAIKGDIDRLPQAHVYYSDRVPWLDLEKEPTLPKRGGPTGMEPL